MKKKIFAMMILSMLIQKGNAQQWNGSIDATNNINREGDITVINSAMQRVTLGAAWGGNPIWGGGYVGFNLRRENVGGWTFLGDGASNDGSVIYTSGGTMHFSIKASTGPGAGSIYDADVVNNIKFSVNQIGTALIGGDYLQQVAIGPAWGNGMYGGGYIGFNIQRDNIGQWDYRNSGSSNGAFLIWADASGGLNFTSKANSNNSQGGFVSDQDIINNNVFKINSNGKIGIGNISSMNINTPYDYRLYVEKGILTERVRVAVKNSADWADFVFQPSYEVMPLTELGEYIAQHKHLPEVPSADEVVKQGIDMAQMDAKLLQKIEELTIYILQQQKEIDALKVKASHNK